MESVKWHAVTRGRQGAVLVRPDKARGIPIVRVSDRSVSPAQLFSAAHVRLAHQIQSDLSSTTGKDSVSFSFNNALIETYTNEYASMGFHSDQALDLMVGSYIAVFSCYRYPYTTTRKLVIEPKDVGSPAFEIPLTHNSVVLFSLDTNRRFKHKILLDKKDNPPQNEWLGITFRTSKTFVHFKNDQPYFEDGVPLSLADEGQRKEFYKLRSQENREVDFFYPRLTYTISQQDTMSPFA